MRRNGRIFVRRGALIATLATVAVAHTPNNIFLGMGRNSIGPQRGFQPGKSGKRGKRPRGKAR